MTRHKVRETDFTRNRSLPFSYIVVCLISLIKSTLQHELDEFFKSLFRREFSDQQVTDSAFCQARRKIKPTAFIELSQQVVSHFYQEADYKKWKGHRLVGIDGCKINLPYSDSIAENFHPQTKSTKAGKTIYMANVSQAFDLLNHMVLDASISSTKGEEGSEFRQALHHIHKLQPGDVILADRGYPGFIMFSAILSQGLDFCMRLPKSSFKQANDFMQSKAKEAIVTIAIRDKKVKAKCKRLGYPTDEIQVRLVKVKLPTGDTEILATSLLDTKVYSRSVFKSLYALRWNVEEAYKRLKHRLHIENFSGKSYLAVLQDFYAKLFTVNLISVMIFQPDTKDQRKAKRLHTYKINWSHAIRKFKTVCIKLFLRYNPENISTIIKLLTSQQVPIRDDRSYMRNRREHATRIFPAYKP